MRKIEKEMCKALCEGRSFSSGNTRVGPVKPLGKQTFQDVYLFDNRIATIYREGNVFTLIDFSDCGWPTATTRSRLNAIWNGVLYEPSPFGIRSGSLHFNGKCVPIGLRVCHTVE